MTAVSGAGAGQDWAGASGEEEAGASGGDTIGGGAPSAGSGGVSGTGAGAGTSAGGVGATGNIAGNAGSVTGGSGSTELIDDFDDADDLLSPIAKRNGSWYAFADKTSGTENLVMALVSGDNYALHFTANGYSDWGVGVGADLMKVGGNKVAYDVSKYRAIRFSAKIASGTQKTVKVLIPTVFSDPAGGKCNDTVVTTPSQRCSDHLFAQVGPIKTTWDTYEVQFSDLAQQGFGLAQSKLDPTSVYSIQFTLATVTFAADLWIDDLSFIVK